MAHETTTRTPEPTAAPASVGAGWVERFGDDLYGYAVRRVGRADAAEDLVQETLLAGVRAWPTFDGRADPGTWLTGILRHKVADHLRARYHRAAAAAASLDAQGQVSAEEEAAFDGRGRWRAGPAAGSGDPHRLAEDREFRRAVDACVGKLPGRMSRLFVGRFVDDVPTADLCVELGITPDYAWTLLHRARLRLRECLARTWFAADRPPAPNRSGDA